MATTITINGSVTLDESLGLQNSGVPVGSEDNNDSDVSLATLQSTVAAFSNRLFNSGATGGLGLSTTFATNNGVAESASNFITVSGGTVASLGFVDGNGGALPVYTPGVTDPNTGVLVTGFTALDGGAIHLFMDATSGSGLGDRMALGIDTQGNVVFAVFMDPNAALTSARVWMVQFEAISNPNANNPDDSVNLFDSIGVAASTSLTFDFNAVHPGSNLFATVGDVNNALIVIAEHPSIDPVTGEFSTVKGGVIKTSQGGGPTTIGVNSQMFDPDDGTGRREGAYFTYVKNPDPNFLASATTDLSPTEANDADNILYSGGTNTATTASTSIVQTQGSANVPVAMKITAYDIADSPQARDFVNGLGTGTPVNITSVKVNGVAVSFTIEGNGVIVSGLKDGDTVAWTTSAPHDRVLIESVSGKFDIGGFAIVNTSSASADIGQQLTFEDDGPTITATATGAPTLTVDETVLATDDTKAFTGQFTRSFGTDGPAGTDSVTYALSTPGGASGLTDTATGEAVTLSLVNGQVVGKTATTGLTVFVVSVDASGNVTLDQQRAVVHANPNDPDESRGLTGSNLVVLTATATDGDADHASAPLDLTPLLVFKDDGPSITATAVNAPTLSVDETFLATNATASFAAQFTPSFGADGQGATPVSYALSTPGGASGLTDTATGEAVTLSLVNGQVVGKTATTGLTVFVVSVDASGNVTLDQQRAIVHTNPNDPNESRGLTGSNLVVLTATATDKDGDHASAPLDLTPQLVFKDDGPSIGPVLDSTVDFTTGATGTATKSLVGAVGADPNNAPYTIVGTSAVGSFPDISINGTTLRPVLSNNNETLTYNAAGTDGTFGTADDVPFYRLTLSETDNSGAGSYTFTVLVNPQPAKLTFDLSTLASGQNLWGAAADTSKATGFEVFANNVTLNADGTQASGGTTNTSKGGGPTTIGISNQMFDPGEGAFFTYVTNPTTGGSKDADNINYNGLFQATEAQAAISQTQGNTPVELTVKAFEISSPVSPDPTLGRDLISGAGTGSPVSITAVHIFDSTGKDVTNDPTDGRSFTITAGVADIKGLVAGDTFDWTTGSNHDQVQISNVTGKWDIGAFNIIQTQPTPAQDLPFKVQATDGDSDFAQASFNVHINAVVA